MLRPEVHLLGNHLLENGFGLACAGAAAEGVESDAWWKAGCALLGWQLETQFLADGGHIERSASYHLALLAALLETIEIARAAGRQPPPEWVRVASRALGWANAVRAPDGTVPLFNDASLDAAPAVEQVAALARAVDVEAARVEHVQQAKGARLATLEATGWLILEVGDAWLALDAGPDAEGWQPGHAHADGLTFEMWVRGERAIVDFGVASYASDEARRETRATRSHNTVELGGTDSCEVWGAFRVGRRGRGAVRSKQVQDRSIRVEVEHDGYARQPGAGERRHLRSVELRESRLEVTDRVVRADEPWVSRLRVDAGAAVRVSGVREMRTSDGRWFARHGVSQPARLFEQDGNVAGESSVTWRVEW
jgi:uncharacterized heparinase superfamily protein